MMAQRKGHAFRVVVLFWSWLISIDGRAALGSAYNSSNDLVQRTCMTYTEQDGVNVCKI